MLTFSALVGTLMLSLGRNNLKRPSAVTVQSRQLRVLGWHRPGLAPLPAHEPPFVTTLPDTMPGANAVVKVCDMSEEMMKGVSPLPRA